MPELFPDDATLLTLTQDSTTGVPYIPVGLSPYHVAFRQMQQRMLLAMQRANDFRVYADGDLSIGLRGGRCVIGGLTHTVASAVEQGITAAATTHVYLDSAGILQLSTTGLPADTTTFLPLAAVTADATRITAIQDLRGDVLWHVPNNQSLGLTVSVDRINDALDGTNASVSAAALNALTAGGASTADLYHRHTQSLQNANAATFFSLINNDAGGSANVGLVFSLPAVLPDDTLLLPDRANGFLTQQHLGVTHHLLGATHPQFRHTGNLTATLTDQLIGPVPVTGVVQRVILSVGTNLQSSTGTDSIEAQVKRNGNALTTTHPRLTSAAGSGFRSTGQSHGTASVIVTNGQQNVTRGDVLTLDLVRTVAGSVSVEARHVAVLIVIRATQPE